ncbi:MAG: c-type cytochrome biogenesis protein CcmI [Magnetospirillum sp.]|nr:c-type cytochrome biogenesis protein CcmI [Magnetospirillum sp.]
MIWVLFAVMAAVAVAFLVVPLLRPAGKAAERSTYDLVVYKDQLAEIARDVERGVLTADQAEAAKAEVGRRMLGAAQEGKGAEPRPPARRRPAVVVAVAALVPLLAFGLYAGLGSPFLPDQPAGERSGKMQQQAAMVQDMVTKLAERLEQNPADGKGWFMLGRSYRVLGDMERAKTALETAIKLLPGDVAARMEYAAVLLAGIEQGAKLPPAFVATMREVVALDAGNADALYFLGVAAAQAGKPAEARALWTRLLQQMPPDSAERAEIQQQIDALGR